MQAADVMESTRKQLPNGGVTVCIGRSNATPLLAVKPKKYMAMFARGVGSTLRRLLQRQKNYLNAFYTTQKTHFSSSARTAPPR